jgi:hypothetical protein
MSSKKHNQGSNSLLRAPRQITDDAVFDILESIDSPRSLAVWLLYSHKEHHQLVSLDVNPLHYRGPLGFRDDYLATKLLSKSDFLKTGLDLDSEAMCKFSSCEEKLKMVNARFRNLDSDPEYVGQIARLFFQFSRKISSVLGDVLPIDEILDAGNWGPGVTTTLKGNRVSSFNKFRDERGITRSCYRLVGSVFHSAYPLWSNVLTGENRESTFDFQEGNLVTSVPKDAKANRIIAIEPGINLWFQKGIGSVIRSRLKEVGIDLNRGQLHNQLLAREASITGEFATVDFSSASDTISKNLIMEVLPPDWFTLLDACRSPVGRIGNRRFVWEKFSSMGNGFTFELESLVFYAAAYACCQELSLDSRRICVYGDDVILPTKAYQLFRQFSEFLGFSVNDKKSYSSGPFRESCGAHYFDGVDVKPFFLRKKISNVETIYHVANSIRNLSHSRLGYYGCDSRFRHCWDRLVRRLPERFQKLKVPFGFGDIGLSSNFDEAVPIRAGRGIEGYRFRALITVPVRELGDGPGLLLARLRSLGITYNTNYELRRPTLHGLEKPVSKLESQGHGNNYDLRGRVRSVISEVLVNKWYDYGPWI